MSGTLSRSNLVNSGRWTLRLETPGAERAQADVRRLPKDKRAAHVEALLTRTGYGPGTIPYVDIPLVQNVMLTYKM